MTSSVSISRRLTISVLLLELTAALMLVATVAAHERHVQYTVFRANLRENANILFGALQEADTKDGSIVLDHRRLSLPAKAAYSITDQTGDVLGRQGQTPNLTVNSGSFEEHRIGGNTYLFYVLTGDRNIDPGKPYAVYHHVRIIYGMPVDQMMHEVLESVRFFTLATLILLGITALSLSWLVRKFLTPIRELADSAEKIDANHWSFDAPESSKRFLELRPLASAIEKTILRLQASFEQQRRFTSNAAHELKTDLAIVKSSFQLLEMRQRAVEEYEAGISAGLQDIRRAEVTVQKMLTLARVAQADGMRPLTCNFTETLIEAVEQVQPFAKLKDVALVPSLPDEQVILSVGQEDGILLCSNILMNALQYSSPGGVVRVDLEISGSIAMLRIQDGGPGIAEQDKPFLFDAFYRGDTSRSRKTGGTGLGLSICRAICNRSGGSIAIGNGPSGGAIVEIHLPLVTNKNAGT